MRTTAAKQLAQLAAKSVISDVAIVEEDVKAPRQHVAIGDSSGWPELMAVVARVGPFTLTDIHLFIDPLHFPRYFPTSTQSLMTHVLRLL